MAALLPFLRVTPRTATAGTHASITLSGPFLVLARAAWIALALLGVIIWILAIPTYHRHALSFETVDCCVARQPDVWRTGMDRLGLSPSFYAAYRVVVESLMGWSMFLIGGLIFLRKSDEWIALFVSITLLGLGMTATNDTTFSQAYPPWIAALVEVYATLPFLAFFLIPLAFPDGRFVPRWTAAVAAIFTFDFAGDGFFPDSVFHSENWPQPIANVFAIGLFGTILVAPIYRYRYVSDSVQRRQTRWAVLGLISAIALFLAVGSVVPALVPSVGSIPSQAVLYDMASTALSACGFVFVAVAFCVAILRDRLWNIDLILNRTLVYATLSASVIGIYILVVVGLGALVPTEGGIVPSLVAAALATVLFQPLRERLQRGVNRLLYGERDEPYTVISRLGRQLERTLNPDAVLPVIVQTVAQALKLPYAAVALKAGDGFTVMAATGAPANDALILPLLYQGDKVGQLILGMRPGEAAFSPTDRRLLEDLAHQAGAAAFAVRLNTDLQHSRQRLVTAREEERRRLRRDLHDGLGPALASMAMQSEAARDLLASQPAQSELLLADLTDQLQEAITDIRRLVHDLRPPALDDLGLSGALHSQISRFGHSGLRITLDAPDALPSLTAAVEVAAYRIVLEALTNVTRHAGAQNCLVRLSLDDDVLQLEISDDGQGIANEHSAGTGMASMRERAAELGGICLVEAREAGGATVRATLPVTLDGYRSLDAEPEVPS